MGKEMKIIDQFLLKFFKEYNKNGTLIANLEANALEKLKIISESLSCIQFQDFSIEFTSEPSMFFDINVSENIKIHLEIELANDEAFFNFFLKRESQDHGFGKLADVLTDIKLITGLQQRNNSLTDEQTCLCVY